jgi:hypothetical protein
MTAVNLFLLIFSAIGFAAAGAALAVGRARELEDGDPDLGMWAIAVTLALFAAACTSAVAGWLGIIAFGAVVVWASYVLCAHRIGVFRIEHFESPAGEPAER